MAWNRNLAGRDDLELRILDNKLVAYVGSEDNLHGGLQGEVFSVTSNLAKPEPTPEPTETDVSDSEPAPQTLTSPTAPAAPVAPESAQESAAVEQSPPVHSGDTSEIESLVVEVVVEHTGYPADFIELDQDLEGELGIEDRKSVV